MTSTFQEKTDLLDEENMLLLKNHYVGCYWHLRKNFLDYLEDSMSQDSLIGSTISTISKKTVSCASKISSPSDVSEDTKVSKSSEKSNARYLYPKESKSCIYAKT